MKKFFSLFALVLALTGGLLAQDTPTPEEIGKTYIENIGGAEAWLKVKNMVASGTAEMQGMQFPMTLTTAEGDKFRVDVNVQGQQIIQASDGETAWQVMPFMGINEPTKMSEEEAVDMNDQAFLSEFINTEERGYKLSAAEGKEIEGTKTLAVRVTNDEGVDRTYYFDPEYMIPVAMSSKMRGGQMKGMEMMTLMSDYQEFDGLMMATFTDAKINGQTVQKVTLKDIKINTEVDDKLFSLPE